MALTVMVLSSDLPGKTEVRDRSQRQPIINLDSELVVVDVTVTDAQGRPVIGLKKENFRVYEDHVLQEIVFFDTSDHPVSIGLVLDRSMSMMDMLDDVRAAVTAMVEAGTKEDEIFLMAFNNKVERLSPFTIQGAPLMRSAEQLTASGPTALYDGIRKGLAYVIHGRHRKKALIVVTDGMDNSSKITHSQLRSLARERGVPIYIIGLSLAAAQISDLSEITGGKLFYAFTPPTIRQACMRISVELHQQYTLAYYPRKPLREGEWRTIQVDVVGLAPHAGQQVRFKKGYYVRRPYK